MRLVRCRTSMKEILTPEERAACAAAGWSLHHVYDSATKKVSVRAFSSNPKIGSETLHALIARRALANDVLAQRVLRIITESNK